LVPVAYDVYAIGIAGDAVMSDELQPEARIDA